MNLVVDIRDQELLKSVTVNTATAAEYLNCSQVTIRRYSKQKGALKLRNVGYDGSFRFTVYDLMLKRAWREERSARNRKVHAVKRG